MKRSIFLTLLAVGLGAGTGLACRSNETPAGASGGAPAAPASVELLNVSYDPTRELWRDLNEKFTAAYEKETGTKVTITLRDDVPFYSPMDVQSMDFGMLDANEVVEWLNRSNSNTNAESTYGDAGDFAAIFGEARVVDEHTLEIDLVQPVFFCLPISQFGCLSAARGPQSRRRDLRRS